MTNTLGVRLLVPMLGFVVATVALYSGRISPAAGTLSAGVRFVATPPGIVATDQSGSFAAARALRPGQGEAHGRLTLTNVSGQTLRLQARGLPSSRDLDRLVRVRLSSGERTLFRGPLGAMRSWTRSTATLGPGERVGLAVRAWLPRSASTGYEGRDVDVTLELRAGSGS